MACRGTNDKIIRREKDIGSRLLRTCEVQGVVGTKTKGLEYLSPFNCCRRQCNDYACPAEYRRNAMSSFMIGRVVDLFFHDDTTDPLPFTRVAVPQNQENRFCF